MGFIILVRTTLIVKWLVTTEGKRCRTVKSFWWHCFYLIRSVLGRSILHFIYFLILRFSNKIQVTTNSLKKTVVHVFYFNAIMTFGIPFFSAQNTIGLSLRETKLTILLHQKSRHCWKNMQSYVEHMFCPAPVRLI